MAENVQVASLTAPITVKIPTDTLNKFHAKLEGIADTLEFIVEQLKDVSKEAKRGFKGVGKSLKVQNITQNRYIDGQKQVHENQKKTASNAIRTSKIYGAWADKLAQARVGLGLIQFALGKILQLLAVPAGVFAGFTFLAAKTNKITSEMSKLSEAVGFSLNGMRALTMEAQGLGFTFEHVNSLVEELNNKLGGEAGGFVEANLQEGLSSLNLEAKELQKLEPEEQIAKIMNASQALIKNGRTAELSSAFDKIFGQEGNRLLTAFAQKMELTGKTYEEIINYNKRISGISGEAEQGARGFTAFFQTLTTSIQTVGAELFGKFGAKLKPFFRGLMPLFEDLPKLVANKLGPAIGVLADKFTRAFAKIINVLGDLLKDPERLTEIIDSVTDGLHKMWDIGVVLAKTIFGLLELLVKFRNIFPSGNIGTLVAGLAAYLLYLKSAKIAVAFGVMLAKAKVALMAGLAGLNLTWGYGLRAMLIASITWMGKIATAIAVGMGTVKTTIVAGFASSTAMATGSLAALKATTLGTMATMSTAVMAGVASIKATLVAGFVTSAAAVTGSLAFIKTSFLGLLAIIKTSLVAGLIAAKGAIVAFGGAAVTALSPILLVLGKVALAVAAVTAVLKAAWEIGKWFANSKLGDKVTDFIADKFMGADMDAPDTDPRATAALAQRKKNMDRLTAAGESGHPSVDRSNTSTVHNVNNTIVVNDPETGRAIKEEVFDTGKPQ